VLPPKSFKFIPKPLDKLYLGFPEFYPDKFKINYEGKKKKWEGIVELPPIDVDRIKSASEKLLPNIPEDDSVRNIVSIPVIYSVDGEFISEFRSVFGTIKKSRVSTEDLIF
jgi:5'-3' exonuclease